MSCIDVSTQQLPTWCLRPRHEHSHRWAGCFSGQHPLPSVIAVATPIPVTYMDVNLRTPYTLLCLLQAAYATDLPSLFLMGFRIEAMDVLPMRRIVTCGKRKQTKRAANTWYTAVPACPASVANVSISQQMQRPSFTRSRIAKRDSVFARCHWRQCRVNYCTF